MRARDRVRGRFKRRGIRPIANKGDDQMLTLPPYGLTGTPMSFLDPLSLSLSLSANSDDALPHPARSNTTRLYCSC